MILNDSSLSRLGAGLSDCALVLGAKEKKKMGIKQLTKMIGDNAPAAIKVDIIASRQ